MTKAPDSQNNDAVTESPSSTDEYSEAEADARREAVLKNILSTPPKPLKDSKKKKKESQRK